jgi:hypothetical protein
MHIAAVCYCLFQDWLGRAMYFAHKTFGSLRISELFDIIVDFPDSRPAIEDLKEWYNCIILF